MELGGNAPCIVFDDAEIDIAVKGSVRYIFWQVDTYEQFNMSSKVVLDY